MAKRGIEEARKPNDSMGTCPRAQSVWFLPDSMFGVDDDVQLAGIKQDGSQTKEPQE